VSFVTLTKDQFEDILPEEFEQIANTYGTEIIYQIATKKEGVGVRIYSTVDSLYNKTRAKGKDAIRVVFWDSKNNRPLGKGKKILRVEEATTIEDRVKERIEEFLVSAKVQEIIDFNYVRFILENCSWSEFAQSLLDNLSRRDSLSDKQLAYVLGEMNPKGRATFEAMVKKQLPDLQDHYLTWGEREEERNEKNRKNEERPRTTSNEETAETNDQTEEPSGETQTERNLGLVLEGAEELISTNDYPYKFSHFNKVQSAVFPFRAEDSNVVVGANTSSGKTIAAELIMFEILKEGKKIIYMSPLKSLSTERFMDWTEGVFSDKKVLMLTGDTLTSKRERDRQMGEANTADVVIMTSELLDSVTRKMLTEKYYWLGRVGLVIVDESHCVTLDSRGDIIECALMRFSSLNDKARIVCLSATMPNVGEFQRWLTLLNKKKTDVINSHWRPVKLDIHYMEYPTTRNSWGREDYWASQERKRSMTVDIAMSKPEEKFLIFVHDKGTGRDLLKRFENAGQEAHFHNADLDFRERKEIEDSFMNRETGLRIMVSTSTTAYGRNLPARNVIIVGVHRGINEVDELDIVQELGRAGRIGYDDHGDVYLVIPENSTPIWQERIKNPRSVTSVINNHHTLAFHVLAEIDNGVIKDARSLLTWYSRSLAKVQNNELDLMDAQGLLDDLERMEMVVNKGGIYTLTGLGKVGSWLYFSPWDVYAWYNNHNQMFKGKLEQDDLALAWALTDIPTNDMGYIPKDVQKECQELQWHLKNKGLLSSNAVVSTLAAYECLRGEGENTAPSVKAGMRGLKFDIERITEAINLIDYNYAKWGRKDLFKVIPIRIAYGIPEHMMELVSIPGIGGKRARKLWDAGVKSVADVADPESKKKLTKLFQPTMAIRIQKGAKKLLDKGRR